MSLGVPQSALPLLTESDYPGFQRLIPELRDISYQEWSEEHQKAVAYRRSRNGSREIAVSPEEFSRWLQDNAMTAHLELLWACIEDKAKRLPQPVAS
jgi:hypothetical protein